MTTVAPASVSGMEARQTRSGGLVRVGMAGLDVFVLSVAVMSLALHGFGVWVDLRFMGALQMAAEWLWVISIVAAVGLWWSGSGGSMVVRAAQWLMLPTVGIAVTVVFDVGRGIWWAREGRVDGIITATMVMGAALISWLAAVPMRKGNAGRPGALRLAGTMLFTAAVTAVAAGFLAVHGYERPPPAGEPMDLAVVLGGRLGSDGRASAELSDRVKAAINLYQRGIVKKILLSGGLQRWGTHTLNEIAAMHAVCTAAGVPEDAIDLDFGENTKSTAFDTRQYMLTHGCSSVVACTSDYHTFRTAWCFRQEGIDAYVVAARQTVWQGASVRDTLRELAAIVVYRFDPHYREPLAMTMQLKNPRVRVKKGAGVLELFDGAKLVKSYPCISGGNKGDKAVEGDRKTPEGTFRIVFKNPESKYHLSLGLDYPSREDAERGLASGLITRQQHDDILAALASDLTKEANQKKLWYTPLGGEIFIHGHGEGRSGTAGCVAVANPDVEELFEILPLGTQVEIVP